MQKWRAPGQRRAVKRSYDEVLADHAAIVKRGTTLIVEWLADKYLEHLG